MLTESLTLTETPLAPKVARLLLASDILHNSTAPVRNASRYRSLLEATMPDIFESLQVICLTEPAPHSCYGSHPLLPLTVVVYGLPVYANCTCTM